MSKQEISIPSLATKITSEAAAYEYLEGLRWNGTTVCPHCGAMGTAYFLNPANGSSRSTRTGSISERRVWKCKDCRKQFSVLTGTIFHGTKIPVRTWLFVIFEMCASKNGVSAREIERKYDLTAKSAWFVVHRIREAMKREPMAGLLTGAVIVDETYIGGKPRNMHAKQRAALGHMEHKTAVISLVHKESGEVRSEVVEPVTSKTLREAIERNVVLADTVLHSDSHAGYVGVGKDMAGHQSVNHTVDEYVRGDVTTNHAEGYFSQLKRSIDGTHHHVSAEHLPRYLAEFDYRFTTRHMNDAERMSNVVGNSAGRRLTYKPITAED